MSFEADLKTHLGAAAIVALVGDRVYPVIRPQGSALPAVTYQRIAEDAMMNLDGIDTSLRQVRVQIDCWASTYAAVASLALAMRDRMNAAAATFTSVLLTGGGLDDYEPETRLYRRSMDFHCWFKE